MQHRRLGETDLEISTLGFGAWAIGGGGWWGGWGAQDDDESVAALQRALELGIDWIDTAPVYGRGHSESVVGRALAGLAEPPRVFTKCGLPWDDDGGVEIVDIRPETIRRELEDSLRRLRVEAIDLYQIHWPTADPKDLGTIEAAWETLIAVRHEGKVRHIGVSNFDAAQLAAIGEIAPIASLQPPYSLLARDVEAETLPACERAGIGVIVYSPMASGLLSGSMTAERAAALPEDDWRRTSASFQEPQLSRNLAVAEGVKAVAARLGIPPGQVAIAWALRHTAVTGAIVGFRRPDQVEALAGAANLELSDEVAAELESLVA